MKHIGVIVGGWEYVWTAYGATAAVLVGYAASLFIRYRGERHRAEREAGQGGSRE